MLTGQPSRTARGAAAHRAIHQVVEGGAIFADPLAVAMLGESADALRAEAAREPERRGMRLFVNARARIAEEALAAAVTHRGVRQLVVLGAGLDTFAYRNPHAGAGLRVFEVDYPATQAWKRERLAAGDIVAPASLTFAPIDFETQTLADALQSAGFDAQAPAFFTWLGVVPYLREEAIFATLGFVGGLPGKAEIVFDYGEPAHRRTPEQQAAFEKRAAQVAALGEPWLSFFEPEALSAKLRTLCFTAVEDWDLAALGRRFWPANAAAAAGAGGHVLKASTMQG